jgi:hypothetical protein
MSEAAPDRIRNPDDPGRSRGLALLLVLCGLLLVGTAVAVGHRPLLLMRGGAAATGTVVRLALRPVKNIEGRFVQHAVVRFSGSSGDPVEFEDTLGTDPPAYRVGETVQVLYRPDSPASSAVVNHGVWNVVVALALGAVGLLCLAMGRSVWLRPPGSEAALVGASLGSPASAVPASAPPRATRWAIGLSVLAVALLFAPPSHKSGNAAMGALLCMLAAVIAMLRAIIDWVAKIAFAALSAAAATREGAARGMDAGDSAEAWEAAAEESPRLRSLRSRYAHFRGATATVAMLMLLVGVAMMALALLVHVAGGR